MELCGVREHLDQKIYGGVRVSAKRPCEVIVCCEDQAGEVELWNPLGGRPVSSCIPNAGHGAVRFRVCPAGF